MPLLQTLERKYSRYIPEGSITKVLIVGQAIAYVLTYAQPRYASLIPLTGLSVLQGEVWRLFTFLFTPISPSLIFVIFAWYFLYMCSNALESRWGPFRYLLYVLIGYVGAVICAFLFPLSIITNVYIYLSLFLAFAALYPHMQMLLFFIIPVKVKWLGWLAWFGLLVSFFSEGVDTKILLLLSLSNYFFFFWSDIKHTARVISRGITGQSVGSTVPKKKPLHVCAVCGKNEINNPEMEIRYCNKCFPETCYCGDHIRDHQHKRAVN